MFELTEKQREILDKHDLPDDVYDYPLVTEYDPDFSFVYFDEFLPADLCDELVSFFHENAQHVSEYDYYERGGYMYDKRILHTNKVPGARRAKAIIQQAQLLASIEVAHFFGKTDSHYPHVYAVTRSPKGLFLPAHADNEYGEEVDHPYHHRRLTANLYLNDDFEGGDFFFVNQRIRIRPKKGLLVGYTSGKEYTHGVTTVENGIRYTMSCMFTDRAEFADPQMYDIF